MDSDSPTESLADRTVKRLRLAVERAPVVGVPEVIRLVQELSTKSFSITINELAEIIEQDVAVTAKVIGSANTVGYNPSGTPISTVSQSIQVVGFERVRNLALSLLLAENATQAQTAPEQREVAAFALSSGLFAQALMKERGGDPEQAFVCTSLRSYGRLLMTSFMIDEYRKAMTRAQEVGEEAAFREVFGLTPVELSYELLQGAQLPRDILRTVQKLPSSLIMAPVIRADDELIVVADFSTKLCELTQDSNLGADKFRSRAAELSRYYGDSFRMDSEDIQDTLNVTLARYNDFGQTYGVHRPQNSTMRMVAARANDKEPPEEVIKERIAQLNSIQQKTATTPLAAQSKKSLARPVNPEILTKSIKGILHQIGVMPLDVGSICKQAAESIFLGLSLDACIILRRDPKGAFHVVGESGANTAALRAGLEAIGSAERDVFSLCLQRREDVFIEDVRQGNVVRYLPMWLKLSAPVISLLLMPIVDEGDTKGLIFCLRSRGTPLTLSAELVQPLRALRIHLVTTWRLESDALAAKMPSPPVKK